MGQNYSSIVIKKINYLFDNYKQLDYEIIKIKKNNNELSSIK